MHDTLHPSLIHRQTVHRHVRDALLAQPWLSMDIEPRNQRSVDTGDFSSHMHSRADMITRIGLDRVFGDDISLKQADYQKRTAEFLDSPEQQASLYDELKRKLFGSPFKPHHATHHTTDAITTLKQSLGATIDRAAEPATPDDHEILTAAALRSRIQAFFERREELAFAKSASYPMTAATSTATVKARAGALTDVAMQVLGRDAKSLHAFKIRLSTMAKPGSELAATLTDFLNSKAGEYPSELYDNGRAEATGQHYAQALCDQLKNWVKVSGVTVAVADAKAPGTTALEAALAAKDSRGKGQSAA